MKSVIAVTAVEICRASGASMAVPREVTENKEPIMLDRAHYLKRAEIYERLAEETLDETLAAAFRTSAQNCLATAERIHELEDASS